MKIAIIGAGIAGLSCAIRLGEADHDVTLFDKSRGVGGRMSTRRIDTPRGPVSFDHGAQYLTARDPDFVAAVRDWKSAGVVARWPAAGPDAWVGTPGMNAVARHLATMTDVHTDHRVADLHRSDRGWHVDGVATAAFDAVVVATPPEQAAPLLAPHDPAMASEALACRSTPCWTAMLAFSTPLAIIGDIVRNAGIIGWAARNSAKPGRGDPETWVVQATPDWSIAHLDADPDVVLDALIAALAAQVGGAMPAITLRIAHRWRFARTTANDLTCLWNADDRIGAAGDWLLAPRIESAWLSGRRLADRMAGR
jgi:renalase